MAGSQMARDARSVQISKHSVRRSFQVETLVDDAAVLRVQRAGLADQEGRPGCHGFVFNHRPVAAHAQAIQ